MVSQVPTWLDSTPDGDVPKPPVATRAQGLPFNELTWQNFERLILRLVRREGRVLDCVLYGTPGQTQGGIDILAAETADPARRICYQCKRVEKFAPLDIRNAVDAFLKGPFADKATEFVLCVSLPLEGTAQVTEINEQRERLRQEGISLVKWDGSDGGLLCEKLKLLPELVDDFFSRPWVEAFNGKEAASKLGERLDALDLGRLRPRLSQLYSVLFNQHDPGPLTISGRSADYLYRYVLADVVEAASATPTLANGPSISSSSPTVGSETQNFPAGGDGAPSAHRNRMRIEGVALNNFEARRQLFDWLKSQQNCVVLGEPGYGKSAMLRHLSISLLQQDDALAGQLSPQQLRRLPAWMSFAAFAAAIERNKDTSVEDYFRDWLHRHGFDDLQALFERSLCNSEVLLLVDGLDEAITPGHARIALDRLVTFVQAKGASVVCTSRPRGFGALGVPGTWSFVHLAPFDDKQILDLSARWFALTDDDTSTAEHFADALSRAQTRGETFLAAVRANARTHQLARTPLLCQTLIELFRKSPRLPEERVAVYGEIISLVLSRHPGARARAADEASPVEYGDLGPSDIRKVLVRLAYAMQSSGPVVVKSTEYCEAVCAAYLEDDQEGLGRRKPEARRQAQTTIADLVTRFGVLVERSPQELGFVHLSIQEFLAAEAITRQPEREQLDWVSRVWMSPAWRECLVNWFGLQGSTGKKVFAGQAAARIVELGSAGEFERTQALQLLTDLACSDMGIPVSDARRIVQLAAVDVEESSFVQHRVALGRSLTVGALGSTVRDECSALIRRWLPGRPSLQRAACLTALSNWKASDDLRATLVRGMLDEDGQCRRASGRSLVTVFAEDDNLLPLLKSFALHHVRPEVRAAAVRALGLKANWADEALLCANANLSTANAELLFEAVKTRVHQRKHDDDDFHRMSRLWAAEAVDFWQREEFIEVLLDGWPNAPKVRESFLAQSSDRQMSRLDGDGQLVYLMRAYPSDEEVAKLLAGKFHKRGLRIGTDARRLWPAMRDGFRGHPALVPAIREALTKYRKEHEKLFWHPNEIGAYMVLGDDAARDDLIAMYGATEDAYGNYWIARTLFDGWPNDATVLAVMKTWAQGPIDVSAPLATWSRLLFSDVSDRRAWLERLAAEGKNHIVVQALLQLLEQFSDEKSIGLIRDRMDGEGIWYYSRVELESRIAAILPTQPSSLDLFERSLRDLDGPPVAPWVKSVESNASLRSRVLAAAVPAAADVRMSIAATLQVRMADGGDVSRLIPEYLAEASGAIRATVMSAVAQTGKGDAVTKAELSDRFVAELTSSGTHYDSRRRCALAALLELNAAPLVADTLERTKEISWTSHLVDTLDPDPVSLSTIVRHWHSLRPLLEARGLATELPINSIVSAGYGSVLDQSPELKVLLDQQLRGAPSDWSEVPFLELLARRYPRSELLCSSLIGVLERGHGHYQIEPAVARLLAQHFGGNPIVWERIRPALTSQSERWAAFADGVLGYLACGWRDEPTRVAICARLPAERAEWGRRDKLLVAVASGDNEFAEQIAKAVLAEPLNDRRYRAEDTEALREWAKDPIASAVLLRWSQSEDATLSMTAIALMNDQRRVSSLDVAALRTKLNEQCRQVAVPPDGLDPVARRTEAWCTSVYGALATEMLT